jgi:hypothetical protein
MVIHFFFEFFCMKIQYETFYIFERLGRMHENKTFFFCFSKYCFCNISEKIGYFNIGFVFLHYKNTNQY